MLQNVRIFVEGKKDIYFLKSYIEYLGYHKSISEIERLNGWKDLKGHAPTIERRLDDGETVLIIFDADEDCEKRKFEIEELIRTNTSGEISSQNSDLDIFLFPNNKEPGEIEDLLMEIVVAEHKKVFDCFEDYKKCLKRKNVDYELPDIKGKVYSYKEATGIFKKEKKEKENYFRPKYWDFQNPFLDPLKVFIKKYLG